MIIRETSNPLDKLPWESNFPPPTSQERLAAYQKRIDRIAGLASNGRSNVRVIWAPDPDPAISMHRINGELTARYGVHRQFYDCERTTAGGVVAIEQIEVDICLQRYVFEEYHEPAEESFNHSSDTTGQGFYSHIWTVAHHDERCCGGLGISSNHNQLCVGSYREPNERDLDRLQMAINLRDQATLGHRAGERVSYDEVMADIMEVKASEAQTRERRRSAFEDTIRQHLLVHGWKAFTDDPSKLANGKYHFAGGHSKSGATVDQIEQWRKRKSK